MANPGSPDGTAAPARLPQRPGATARRGHGRAKPDWALVVPIPAAIASDRDLLFTQFGDTLPLMLCLQNRLVSERPAADAVIAVADVLYAEVNALLAGHDVRVAVQPVSGRGTREECLSAALARIDPATQYVLVHDIHRPLAPTDLTDRILDRLREGNDVVIPALPMVDSVKVVDSTDAVTETVDRSRLRSAQYPRGFHRAYLATILGALDAAGDLDEIILADRTGPTIIEGDPDAFALDFPRDIKLAEAIYTCRLADER